MVRSTFALILLALSAGCATHRTTPAQGQYVVLSKMPTPDAWTRPADWQFHIVDPDGKWVGALVLRLTDTPTETCTSGEWRLAQLKTSTADDVFLLRGPVYLALGSKSKIAYHIKGASLWIDLNANICDSNSNLRGELLETGAVGHIDHSTLFGGTPLGTFTAAPAYQE